MSTKREPENGNTDFSRAKEMLRKAIRLIQEHNIDVVAAILSTDTNRVSLMLSDTRNSEELKRQDALVHTMFLTALNEHLKAGGDGKEYITAAASVHDIIESHTLDAAVDWMARKLEAKEGAVK